MTDYELESAKRALKYAKEGINKYGKEYKNLCKSFGSMVMSNGLAQAVSFCEAKGDNQHKELIKNIEDELKEMRYSPSGNSLSEKLLSMHLTDYMEFQRQLMITIKWLRRYVDIWGDQNGV